MDGEQAKKLLDFFDLILKIKRDNRLNKSTICFIINARVFLGFISKIFIIFYFHFSWHSIARLISMKKLSSHKM